MRSNVCSSCKYFRQHYGLDSRKIFQIYCGHCTFSSAKRKKPDTKACEHFMPADPGQTSFVTKEYLSKELLKYVLELDLFPDIHHTEEKIK